MTTHPNSGSRWWSRGAQLAVWGCALFLVAALVPGCGLDTPSSPNQPGDLDGNNPNQWSNFTGTVRIVVPSTDLPADDTSALTITAVVADSNGQPATNLTPVTFRTSMGTFGDPTGAYAANAVTVNSFGGSASADLRSFQRDYGEATVYASVGNVSAEIDIDFEYVQVEGHLSLAFRVGGDLVSVTGFANTTTPFRADLAATAFDLSANPLAGAEVVFRIVSDDTLGSGKGAARLEGSDSSFTNVDGEAFNQLVITGSGTVVLEADLVDPESGAVISTSNQIFAVTTAEVFLRISFSNGSTVMTAGTPAAQKIIAEVTDANLNHVQGMFIRFTIQTDATGVASLTPLEDRITGPEGATKVTLNVPSGTSGQNIVVKADVLDGEGTSVTTSNTITFTVQ